MSYNSLSRNFWKACAIYLSLSLIFDGVQGGFRFPFLAPLDVPLDGVELFPDTNITHITENIGEESGFLIAKILLDAPSSSMRLSASTDPRFSVTAENGGNDAVWLLRTSVVFDYEGEPGPLPKSITLSFIEGTNYVLLRVFILNVNDNKPKFDGTDPDTIEPVEELKFIDTPIVKILASDPDSDEIKFKIVNEESTSLFEIRENGEIFLKKDVQLNYSQRISHRININITDGNVTHDVSIPPLTILVKDIPNLPPQFIRLPSINKIEEETAIGTEVLTVEARDGDYGVDWDVIYEIKDEFDLFEINRDNGKITIKSRIDSESEELKGKDMYQFNITATEVYDKDKYPDLTKAETELKQVVTFTIEDINDQKPLLCSKSKEDCVETQDYSFEIFENHTGPIEFDKPLIVIDLDATTSYSRFTARFKGGTDQFIQDAFSISPLRGISEETFSLGVKKVEAIDFDKTKNWHLPVSFTIEIVGENDATHIAVAHVTATINDVNDIAPKFKQPNYDFVVCENSELGVLKNRIRKPGMAACVDSEDGEPIVVEAEDGDITEDFGQTSVIYRWSNTRQTFIGLGPKKGDMNVTSESNFDYERFTEEIYIVEALDSEGDPNKTPLLDSTVVRFFVLDRNDMPVDLQFQFGTRATIPENKSPDPILSGIIASDVDVNADIEVSIKVNTFFKKFDSKFHHLDMGAFQEREDVNKWFALKEEVSSNSSYKVLSIVHGEELPDREGYGIEDIDRVDLRIEARDKNTETGSELIAQTVTIIITDVNDNKPIWPPGEDYSDHTVTVVETEDWGENDTDSSSDYEREIFTIRATDPDKDTEFNFTMDNPECTNKPGANKTVCEAMLTLFELTPNKNPNIGTAILRRRSGELIDREDRAFYQDDIDKLYYRIVISDGKFELISNLEITVEDRNDNSPVFEEDYKENTYYVNEDESTEKLIVKIEATDKDRKDKYGKISYLIINGLDDKFKIDSNTGELTAITIPNTYNWTLADSYDVEIKAIDNYRPGSSSESNFEIVTIKIEVIDKNNHGPEFLTKSDSDTPIVIINERKPVPNDPFNETIMIRDIDNPDLPNGRFSVSIVSVSKDPPFDDDPDLSTLFRLGDLREDGSGKGNVKLLPIIPLRNFTTLWGTYTLRLNASDGEDSQPGQKFTEANFYIEVKNENLYIPVFKYPENNGTKISLLITTAKPEEPLKDMKNNETVPHIHAEDRDIGDHGHVVYSLETASEGCIMFKIDNTIDNNGQRSGQIMIDRPIPQTDAGKTCELKIKVADNKGQEPYQSDYRLIQFKLLDSVNTPPTFKNIPAPPTYTAVIIENDASAEEELPYADDVDVEMENPSFPDDQIYYHIKGGAIDVFKLRTDDREDEEGNTIRFPILIPKSALDREEVAEYKLTIYASNIEDDPTGNVDPENVDPTNLQYMVVTVTVKDVRDTAPIFKMEGKITGGFSTNKKFDDTISTITVTDPDEEDPVRIYVTSEFTASDSSLPQTTIPFKIVDGGNKSAAVRIQFDPQPVHKGFYTFQITANDSVGMSSTATCQMYMVTQYNIVLFYFLNDIGYINNNTELLAGILSGAFNRRCNIDRVFESEENVCAVETYFIDTIQSAPVLNEYIIEQQFIPEVNKNLSTELTNNKFILRNNGISRPGSNDEESDNHQIIVYALVGGIGVLGITFLILAATCFYNNRSLSRRVRALTATTFGSQQSDLNRAGITTDAPNTNTFAVEGSNPIWTINAEPKTFPDFDTESVGSGGSILIGAEDETYFQKSSVNPMFQAEDVVANYDSDDMSDTRNYDYEPSSRHNASRNQVEEEFNDIPFATNKISRNPLVSMEVGGDSGGSGEGDYDYDGPQENEFEQNSDVALF